MTAQTSSAFVSAPRMTLRHRGFAIHVEGSAERAYRFEIAHRGHPLHTSAPEHLTASSASRTARRFIDDALGSFEYATREIGRYDDEEL